MQHLKLQQYFGTTTQQSISDWQSVIDNHELRYSQILENQTAWQSRAIIVLQLGGDEGMQPA